MVPDQIRKEAQFIGPNHVTVLERQVYQLTILEQVDNMWTVVFDQMIKILSVNAWSFNHPTFHVVIYFVRQSLYIFLRYLIHCLIKD